MTMLKKCAKLSLWVVVFLTMFSRVVTAQTLSVSYKNKTLEEVLTDLKQRTNYNFVYQKQILEGIRTITATYNQMPLTAILDRVLFNNGLDYEIMHQTVIVRQADKDNFKKVVSGRVLDEAGDPLPGSNVRIKGTFIGMATGFEGEFSIPMDGKNPILIFSFVGMLDKEVRITRETQNPITVHMEPDVAMMEEVIVTGYQNLKRENATGAYQLISAKDMDSRYATDVVSSLEGKIPGLVSYNNGHKKGEDALTIRGVGSFQAKTSPLIVVDGLPIEGSLETVNRYDIENITVLKDASAASIYGARASNGVIVITTKRAHQEKLSIDVSADLTVSEKQRYGNHEWANASELLELERYNFDYVKNDVTAYKQLYDNYCDPWKKLTLSPIMQLTMDQHTGAISADAYDAQIAEWKQNDYRKEWQDVMQRKQLVHQYNVAMRTMGKYLNSSIVINYKGDNTGMTRQHDNALNLNYKGDVKLIDDILTLSVGLNLIRENSRTHADYFGYKDMHAFAPYLSMYNPDGTPSAMKAGVDLNAPTLTNPELKSEEYNLLDESRRNFTNANRTNLRSFVHASLDVLPFLNLNARFQYEDIAYKSERYLEKESYDMRHLYNLFTSSGVHYIPDGGMLNINAENGAYYTFRTQANYAQEFNDKHAVEAAAGFEYRETKTRSTGTLLLGYDDQTQTNLTNIVNFDAIRELSSSDLGPNYSPTGSSPVGDFSGGGYQTSEILHRFYSLYFTGGYTYDKRYSASFSYRLDKTDLFGADPEFRGRPLWSAGLSWNLNNEAFIKGLPWLDVLKLRASYGLTGNIDSSVSSFLTASLSVNAITGTKVGALNTPPNDQLRWEKIASWNAGADFSFFNNRLSGSLDWYRKYSSDLLTLTDIDPTTGWSSLTINNGEALNMGVELAINGNILQAEDRSSLGISASLSFAYNKNEIKSIKHEEPDGYSSMRSLHKGRPINSLYSWRFAGYQTDENGFQQRAWYKADGSVSIQDVTGAEFKPEDVVFSGSLDPKYVGSFTPQITWNGFTLAAMCSFYGGHKMRARTSDYGTAGSVYGYDRQGDVAVRGLLNYWKSEDKDAWRANGYLAALGVLNKYGVDFMDCTVVPADYLKVRNIVLAYDFSKTLCRRMGMNGMRLRFQMNNVATWARNKWNIDPETINPYSGATLDKVPRSYTVSLNINF